MRVVSSFVILVVVFAGSLPLSGKQRVPTSNVASVVDNYCSGCHNGTMRSPSGAPLDQLDAARISENPDVWARAYRQLQAGTMPPAGAPRPDRATYGAVLAWIEEEWGTNLKALIRPTSREIAERVAAFLWNSVPDTVLAQDAQRNRLSEPAVLERHVRRMLADDRAQAFVSRFFFPWLGLDRLGGANPDKTFFPDYDVSLRDAFRTETELFLLSQLRDDRDPLELWSANYTFLNEQLARHYAVPNVTGPQFRKVTLPSPERAGLLGQPIMRNVPRSLRPPGPGSGELRWNRSVAEYGWGGTD